MEPDPQAILMTNPLIYKLERRDILSDEERKVLEQSISQIKEVGPDEDIVADGQRITFSTLVLSGWTVRYKLMGDGRRQITSFHIAGDFVDLHSFTLKRMDHSVAALTPCKIAIVPHENLRDITERLPHLTRLLWLSTVIDAAIHREWIIGMGQRSAHGRVGHLFCELYLRLQAVGLASDHKFTFPITQEELADALGFSTVHTNRALRKLRQLELATVKGQLVTIDNWEGLVREAEFDPVYLHLEYEPR